MRGDGDLMKVRSALGEENMHTQEAANMVYEMMLREQRSLALARGSKRRLDELRSRPVVLA